MEIFVAILAVIIVVILFTTLSGNEPADVYLQVQGSPARITLDEAKQINRIASLRYVSPELARALASSLQGDAWQMAQSGLCATLLGAGQRDAALQLLERLDPHHRGVALHAMLEQLIEAGNEHQALELLAATGDDLPQEPLLRVPLLRAQGRLDEARSELAELEQSKSSFTALQLSKLARQQRALEQKESAVQTLELAWQLMQASAETEKYLGLDDLLRELTELGEFARLPAIAEQLPARQRMPAIAELIRAGLFEQARALLEGLPSYQQDDLHEQMLSVMLEHGQLVQAGELLMAVDDSVHTTLLLQLAQWHIAEGTFSTAAKDLQAQARRPQERIDLYLSLWKLHARERPELAAPLLDQAERWVAELAGDEQDHLRFFVLDARLTAQSRLPERQRTAYEIRRGLEEMQRLLTQMDCYSRIAKLCMLARLLPQLGRDEDALTRLAEARELLRNSSPEDELEDFDKAMLLEEMARTYLQLQRLDLALATRSDIPAGETLGECQWTETLVEHNYLEQAIQSLRFSNLFSGVQTLESLLAKIAEQPEQGQARHSQLLAKLRSDELWEPSAAAA